MGKQIVIATFYRFVPLPDYKELRADLKEKLLELDIRGSILLAEEGVNSTISGEEETIKEFFAYLDKDPRLANMEYKESYAEKHPFKRTKVRLKKEIVRLKKPVDVNQKGTYLESEEWDKLLEDPEVIVIDTRNDYEIALGRFKNSVNPNTQYFSEFPKWAKDNLDTKKNRKVAMYCTGGIRCEKSTAFLKQQGFEEVYHLKGGILKYLEETENRNNNWEGNCFVFDTRVTVDDKMKPQPLNLCDDCSYLQEECRCD